ncbi:MAG: OmpA family protein [Proteobacteria bacterium]|nr:OmpA family protein [Pseudomonadota bacterium]
MVVFKNFSKNWIILALCVSLAALTNHSHGEVVYRKLSPIKVAAREVQSELQSMLTDVPTDPKPGLEILRIRQQGKHIDVLLSGGIKDGLLPGTKLEARRLYQPFTPDTQTRWIPTALLQALEVRESYTLARVTEDGSADSILHFPEAPGLMVGDRAEPRDLQISQTIRILPTRVLTYESLFIDPKMLPTSFELSPAGRLLLIDQARVLMASHSPLLFVEGHTDPQGDSQSNQIESYQRALTVRQVLIDEFRLDPKRVIAIGMGESEGLDEPYLPGRTEEARRIVLKIKNQLPPHR